MVKRAQYEALADENAQRYPALQERAKRIHGQPVQLDPLSMVARRLELLIESALGENVAANQSRTQFEYDYHLSLKGALDELEQAITQPPTSSRLIVPGGQQ